jgi:hypothetical protein
LAIEPFSYNLTIASIAAVAGTATGIIAINANADFYCTRINYSATTGTAQNVGTKTVAQLRVLLVDAGSSRPFFNSAQPLESFASNEYPNRFLPYPAHPARKHFGFGAIHRVWHRCGNVPIGFDA